MAVASYLNFGFLSVGNKSRTAHEESMLNLEK